MSFETATRVFGDPLALVMPDNSQDCKEIMDWLRSGGPGYQTRINAYPRLAMIHPKTPANPSGQLVQFGCRLER